MLNCDDLKNRKFFLEIAQNSQLIITRSDSIEFQKTIASPPESTPVSSRNYLYEIEWISDCKYRLSILKKTNFDTGMTELYKSKEKSVVEIDSIIGNTFYFSGLEARYIPLTIKHRQNMAIRRGYRFRC